MKLSFLVALSALLFSWPVAGAEPSVLVLEVEGIINPVVGDYVTDGIKKAESEKAAAVLIQLDTPGGLLDATRTAIGAMVNTAIPVIVYVAPRGARATSAGVFITMASDVAAMAPQTHIGAAHPVTIGGGSPPPANEKPEKGTDKKPAQSEDAGKDPSVMEEKMLSDAAAYIRALARERGRNAEWAERAVRKSVSLTAQEALEKDVIEFVSDSQQELLEAAHGRKIKKGGDTVILDVKNSPLEVFPMSAIQKLLHMIAHPNVAYILLMLGIYGLIYEFASPGIGLGAAVGVTCLLLAFFSLQVLPVNATGLALVGLGVLLLILELFTPTAGILTIGGLIALFLGSLMLIDRRGLPLPRVSLSLILPTVIVTGLFFGVAIKKVFAARRAPATTGQESLAGAAAEVTKEFSPEGMVYLNGELWMARSEDRPKIGDKVTVVGKEGNFLVVKKQEE